ncbi:hypothetical protein NQ315_007828 [Exocentrus adspersus]|uniref:Uncharacterized protein n=1 Tax=Exocentrus adspersus TaxID=1586481 RepID=A0AAV8W827_9CUCU|nr:hypothetical protein NQ315_007828 [Exocentrus adspersus]
MDMDRSAMSNSLFSSSSESEDEACDDVVDVTPKDPNEPKAKEGTQSKRTEHPVYTDEQKIVAAVWMHEKPYNYQTVEDIQNNFRIRFKMNPPRNSTLLKWEKELFSAKGLLRTRSRPLKRLIHVPYVKASLREKPGLTLRERACQLGLSKNSLSQILKYDIKESDWIDEQNASEEQAAKAGADKASKTDIKSDSDKDMKIDINTIM